MRISNRTGDRSLSRKIINRSSLIVRDERDRSMSDDSVMLCLKDEFGITDGQQIQKLSKEERDVILAALLRRHAGVRQLQRLTGIGKNIISNVSKTICEVNPRSWTG